MTDPEQPVLFDIPPDWKKDWQGMPGYDHVDKEPYRDLILHFRNEDDIQKFAKLLDQKVTDQTKYLWYPKMQIESVVGIHFKSEVPILPKYPVFIISKGRADTRLTSKALEKMKVPYWIVIEPQEYDQYAAVIDPDKILVLPFSNLGQGSIPARNWVWETAIKMRTERHWILDDNIRDFYRFQNNLKIRCGDGATFRALEEHVDRYENVAISGMQYYMFVTRRACNIPPFYLNTRVYSCILIKNDIPYRWRGRYNEDTDLSIRALKDGWCTLLFNAFLADKETTLTMKGGNMTELYQGDGRKLMAESLRDQHPDIVRISWKWNRVQHHVDYSGFKKNALKLKPGIIIPETPDEFGMILQKREIPK